VNGFFFGPDRWVTVFDGGGGNKLLEWYGTAPTPLGSMTVPWENTQPFGLVWAKGAITAVAGCSSQDGKLRIHTADGGKVELGDACDRGAALSADGSRVAFATDVGIDVVEWKTGAKRSVPTTGRVSAIAFAPDGKRLAVGYIDGTVAVTAAP
jgi:hypothetical protein